jgi:hypothetical protein
MVAQAALSIVPALPPIPPTKSSPYQGEQTTASVRASLQKALDGYSPGNISLILAAPTGADLKYTRSFGETHARELSRIDNQEPSVTGNIPITPPATTATAPPPQPGQIPHHSSSVSPTLPHPTLSPSTLSKPVPLPVRGPEQPTPPSSFSPKNTMSPPLNPANLNQAPAPIPTISSPSAASPIVAPDPTDPSIKVPSVTPTVAETGVPKVAGPEGPGPASGSLLNKHAPESPKLPNPFADPTPLQLPPASEAPKFESAEEEKKRLEREERERILHQEGTSSSAAPQFESAEDEKKRLEREERERILREGGSDVNKPSGKDEDLPPYQEF